MGDLNLYQNLLYVRQASAKNQYRQREIPLTEQAVWALERLRQRARSLGALHEAHYLFPYSISEKRWEPGRPMPAWGFDAAVPRGAQGVGTEVVARYT